ncbi:c-type cytochrome [Limimaricola litoreus]|uniref:C-type cytochrome n=1 Tax=Limimaricola litoreus TaxID=2955316 RepID=A0A9X2JQK5_9RHOB|nr:c-type cytochrome [Limimaricola litoreus]MCP1167716.1 c-type cytochrome [Limimaricola litoreus]
MQSKAKVSLVGIMVLIGTSSLAESGSSDTGNYAKETADSALEAGNNQDPAGEGNDTDEVESSTDRPAENQEIIGDIAIGEELYQDTCKNCHGPKAQGMASFPKLTGHEATYLVERLTAYREGEKVGPNTALMAPMAADLTDEDIARLALYISETL